MSVRGCVSNTALPIGITRIHVELTGHMWRLWYSMVQVLDRARYRQSHTVRVFMQDYGMQQAERPALQS